MRALLLIGFVLSFACAFSSQPGVSLAAVSQSTHKWQNGKMAIFSSPEDQESSLPSMADEVKPEATSMDSIVEEQSKYPINLPSPILLSTSMILGIAGTGSSFELAGGSPTLGFGTTAVIAAVSIPLSFFLFYASILKATAETEADDAEYMKGRY